MADQIGYSQKVMEHFMNPHNVGVIENPDGYGKVGNPVCGDLMEIFIRVRENVIEDSHEQHGDRPRQGKDA